MTFVVPYGILHLSHQASQYSLSATISLHFRSVHERIRHNCIIQGLPALRHYWITSAGLLCLKLETAPKSCLNGSAKLALWEALRSSPLWDTIGFRATLPVSHLFFQVDSTDDLLIIVLERCLEQVEGKTKFNNITYTISPGDIKPPQPIETLDLFEIFCSIDLGFDEPLPETIDCKTNRCVNGNSGDRGDMLFNGISEIVLPTFSSAEANVSAFNDWDTIGVPNNLESIQFKNISFEQFEEDLFMTHDSQSSTNSVDLFSTEALAAGVLVNSIPHEIITSHLILAAIYVLFHGPLALPPDVGIDASTFTHTLCHLAPSLFDVEYLKALSTRVRLVDIVGRILAGPIASQARSSRLRNKLGKLKSCMDNTRSSNELSQSYVDSAQLISSHVWRLTTKNLTQKQDTWKSSPQSVNSLLRRDVFEDKSSPMLLDSCEQSDSEMSWPSFATQELQISVELDHSMTELPKTEI